CVSTWSSSQGNFSLTRPRLSGSTLLVTIATATPVKRLRSPDPDPAPTRLFATSPLRVRSWRPLHSTVVRYEPCRNSWRLLLIVHLPSSYLSTPVLLIAVPPRSSAEPWQTAVASYAEPPATSAFALAFASAASCV